MEKVKVASSVYGSLSKKRASAIKMCEDLESAQSIEEKEKIRLAISSTLDEIKSLQQLYFQIIKS